MEIEHAILADYAALTADGKLMVAGIFNIIFVEGFPAIHTQLSLAFRLHSATGENPSHSIMIRLVDPDGASPIQNKELKPYVAEQAILAIERRLGRESVGGHEGS